MNKSLWNVAMAAALSLMIAAPAQADGMVAYKMMSPEMALKAAQAALAKCRADGYQVAVAVVDRGGVTQVVLRDRFAGPHTPEAAVRKAWTAVSFRTNTPDLATTTASGPAMGIRDIPGSLVLGGGLKVEAAGFIVGGIGVSGAPGGVLDDACAAKGIEAISDQLNF